MKTYGAGGFWTSAAYVQQTSNSGYVVVGVAASFQPLTQSAIMIRLDGSGNILWQKNFDTSQFVIQAATVVQIPNGKFVVAGTTTIYSTLGVFETAQAWILKLNGNGQAGGCGLASDASLIATNTDLKMVAFAGAAIDVTSAPVLTAYAPEFALAVASTLCR
jgi:hypothetical protein